MLETHQLSIGYPARPNPRCIRSELNLQLPHARLVCLIGPNGCGKSTLLRTLAGLQAPLDGQILIDGQDLTRLPPRQRAQHLSVVLTDRFEVPHLSVRQLVAWSRNPYHGLSSQLTEEDRHLVQQSLHAVGMTELSLRPLSSLSDGERQRALIAAALCQDTPYILLDEPTAHLDVVARAEVMLLLARLARQTGKGILLSTHELELALQTADEFWLLSPQGQTHTGTPAELTRSGALDSAFRSPNFHIDPHTLRMEIRKDQQPDRS